MKNQVKRAEICILSIALMGVLLVGCGVNQQETQQTIAAETMAEVTEATLGATEETAQEEQRYEDNFAVDSKAAKGASY